MTDWAMVGVYASLTALATGLGAIPFAFVRHVSQRAIAYSNALAAGLMLGACFGLISEGTEHSPGETLAGVILGVVFILVAHRRIAGLDVSFDEVDGADARRMVLVVLVMTVHSVAEGIAVGASFGGGMHLATVMTVAIAVHNVPEGVAITAVLRPRGVGLLRSAGWSIFSSLPQPLLAVPAFLFVEAFAPALPYSIGFAAGAMIFMVFMELLPEAFEEAPRARIGLVTSIGLIVMVLFQRFL